MYTVYIYTVCIYIYYVIFYNIMCKIVQTYPKNKNVVQRGGTCELERTNKDHIAMQCGWWLSNT